MDSATSNLSSEIQNHLGQYRAEYLNDKIFELFAKPVYWDRLSDERPCFIIGGRGTGKTTTLRQLAYEGQYRDVGANVGQWSTIGMYWRIESSVTATFQGERFSESEWIRLFSHYINLQFIDMILEFVAWRSSKTGNKTTIDKRYLRRACLALSIDETQDLETFAEYISDELIKFEAAVNGLGQPIKSLNLSTLGRPVSAVVAAVRHDAALESKALTFCLDEYENLAPYQQRVMNTLIKHVGDSGYTFKIGMRRNGLHERATLTTSEFLIEPADYVGIDIEDSIKKNDFGAFAAAVCNERLSRIRANAGRPRLGVQELLPDLSMNSEASLLGSDQRVAAIRRELIASDVSNAELDAFEKMDNVEACVVGFWAESQGTSASSVLSEAISKPAEWKNRVNNYGYTVLFTLRKGRVGISKYYSGWSTYVLLAEGNIRYLLYLVTEALTQHSSQGGTLSGPVSAETQTLAAQAVGERIVFELAGLHARGTQLTRLVLGLGRVFGIMAKQPYGHAPEVTQFRISDKVNSEANALVGAGVMHNALVQFTADKMAASSSETKDFDYQMHPIFAPFFVYSPRRKRRMNLRASELVGLASAESSTYIRSLIVRKDRQVDNDPPQQLSLFADWFRNE
ncbi:hypothetical protein [Paenarthrobacter aromaticivorans]|uniref:ATP-binding protein n=1 Tax=Paenarthrobacter aromaticivorans TaxID=2849150 RepID=A0ABS6I9Q1_9MICC|nr:hypothetical protein [Paenarthrobacter sp. MMS21-TAE1-1]MBU8868440.1 hypothetical protein [Paenarthrobacter sp. MMS21-TAE1-1]